MPREFFRTLGGSRSAGKGSVWEEVMGNNEWEMGAIPQLLGYKIDIRFFLIFRAEVFFKFGDLGASRKSG